VQGAATGIMRFRKIEDADAAMAKADEDGKVLVSEVSASLAKVEGAQSH
jgi:hypothetical protein